MTDESIFAVARAIADPAERAAFLDWAFAGDAAMRREIESLIAADMRTGEFLEVPATCRPDVPDPSAQAGAVIAGRYKLLQEIGEGGMGSVWMAEQTAPVKRLVALKLVKAGMDSRQVLTRFEAERQALAMMDHQNIAKVLDGGTTDAGRPFFAMELVKGRPITAYCDERHLPVRQRLELFAAVCGAVQHAHQKGIIHRDLKPSNVLVTEHDGVPVPKVIDFGLAKALHAPHALTERTLFTAFGTVVGTPLYMAPEQVALNALDVDTRTDIYALGVILYELLTGTTPLERGRLAEAAWDEVRRLIREEEPPRPSVRLSSTVALPSIAASRAEEPARLSRLMKGELDWIALKALDKDRNRRYETAATLAADVRRYLADEPVEACPPSTAYRLRKFARKHKASLLTVAALAAVLLAATGVSLWQAEIARRAVVTADQARAEVETANASLRRSEDELLTSLARGLVRPRRHGRDATANPEDEALWELTRQGEPVRLRFLVEACRAPMTANQLRDYVEPAMIAAVGLDAAVRANAQRWVTQALRDPQLAGTHRRNLVIAAQTWFVNPAPLAGAAAAAAGQWLAARPDGTEDDWLSFLETWVDDFPPAVAVRLLSDASRQYPQSRDRAWFDAAWRRAAERLPVAEAEQAARDFERRPPNRDALATPPMTEKDPFFQLLDAKPGAPAPDVDALCRQVAQDIRGEPFQSPPWREFWSSVAVSLPEGGAAKVCLAAVRALAEAMVSDVQGGLAAIRNRRRDELDDEFRGWVRLLPPAEAERICNELADRFVAEYFRHDAPASHFKFVEHRVANLGTLTAPLATERARPFWTVTARRLVEMHATLVDKADGEAQDRFGIGFDMRGWFGLNVAKTLDVACRRLPRDEGAALCREAVRRSTNALNRRAAAGGSDVAHEAAPHAIALATLAPWLPRTEAEQLGRAAVRTLLDLRPAPVGKVSMVTSEWANGLVATASLLPAGDAARILADAIREETRGDVRERLVAGLARAAAGIPPAEARRIAAAAITESYRQLADASSDRLGNDHELCIASLVQFLPPSDAEAIALRHVRSIVDRPATVHQVHDGFATAREVNRLPAFHLFLTDATQARPHALVAALGGSAGGPGPLLPALPAVAEPLPCRLRTQDLVELLKMPTCTGEIRQVVLANLGNRYGRVFPDHWAFVRFATEQKLGLDFTTPPKRPPADPPQPRP